MYDRYLADPDALKYAPVASAEARGPQPLPEPPRQAQRTGGLNGLLGGGGLLGGNLPGFLKGLHLSLDTGDILLLLIVLLMYLEGNDDDLITLLVLALLLGLNHGGA